MTEPAAGTPRWVKLLGLAIGAAVLIVIVLLLLPGGDHGPVRH